MTHPTSSARDRVLSALGLATLVAGVLSGWLRADAGGVDFSIMHLMGRGILEGRNVYVFNAPGAILQGVVGMVYPPANGFLMIPFALLPYGAGKAAWFLIMNGTLIVGVRALVRVTAPGAGRHVWMLTAGGVLLSASIRWGVMILQGAPFILGLLCCFVAALHTERTRLAWVCAVVATAFKMTLSPPFLGLLLVQRRFVAVAGALATWVSLNALGFLRMGKDALPTYRANVATFESLDLPHNINGPDPWQVFSLPRLDWVFLTYGVTGNLPLARMVNLLCTAAVGGWLLWEGLRVGRRRDLPTSAAFLGPLVCLGSLCVYHHQYDACLYWAPLLLLVFGPASLRKPSWALWLIAPLGAVIALLPIGVVQHLLEVTAGTHAIGWLKLAFPVAFTFGLAGSLAILRRHTPAPETQEGVLDVAVRPPVA